MNWKEIISRKQLARRVGLVKRQPRIIRLEQIKKVGLLWHENDQRAFSYLQEQFRSRSVIVRHLCFSETGNNSDSNVINKKDFNWLGFPASGIIDTFIASDFEVLVNLTVHPCYPLEVITTLSMATLKIGWDRDKRGFLDLNIDVSKQPDSLFLAEQTLLYLQKFAQ